MELPDYSAWFKMSKYRGPTADRDFYTDHLEGATWQDLLELHPAAAFSYVRHYPEWWRESDLLHFGVTPGWSRYIDLNVYDHSPRLTLYGSKYTLYNACFILDGPAYVMKELSSIGYPTRLVEVFHGSSEEAYHELVKLAYYLADEIHHKMLVNHMTAVSFNRWIPSVLLRYGQSIGAFDK